ncbi:MAG: hypothetical protein AAFQ79_11600 [Pseudomonadota bacterium]
MTNFVHSLNAPSGGIGTSSVRRGERRPHKRVGLNEWLKLQRIVRIFLGEVVKGEGGMRFNARQSVELRVQENGADVLVYAFREIGEAADMFEFLREFFPGARFVIQPLRH